MKGEAYAHTLKNVATKQQPFGALKRGGAGGLTLRDDLVATKQQPFGALKLNVAQENAGFATALRPSNSPSGH